MSVDADALSTGAAYWKGVRFCIAAPGWGTFTAMLGFGAFAAENGRPLTEALILSFGLWSMPGQMAYVELASEGVAVIALTIAVTIANLRMLPLTAAVLPMLHGAGYGKATRVLVAQMTSVTSYISLVDVARRLPDRARRGRFYFGFCTMTISLGLFGTTVGHGLAGVLPTEGLVVLVFVTPLYLLMLSARVVDHEMLAAALFGCVAVPAGHLLSPDWGVVIGGVLAGTAAFFIFGRAKRP